MNIKMLAKELGISIGTVSRALNGRPDVNAETRERVLKAADRLGYAPNQSGRSLRQGTTNAIGFMIQTGREAMGESDSFFMPLFNSVQTVLEEQGMDLIVLTCSTHQDPEAYLRRVVSRHIVDGLILSATLRVDPRITLLEKRNIPFVTLGRSESGRDHPWIDLDFEHFARSSVARLAELGHRRIAIAAPASDLNLGFVFVDTYRQALAEHGLAFDPRLVLRGIPTEEGGLEIGKAFLALEARPDAIILVNEVLALGFYRVLQDAGLMPGRDVAVIGFKESPQTRFLTPSLTAFRMSLHELGTELARTLLATMPAYMNAFPDQPRQRLWPMQMVHGESEGKARR
ncbi:putative HTH transcriptional regulator [Salinisphaera sp. LB1]|nr:substrate-binding domain-containing protein [Salinisphaera sp. LB1]AWN16225.1 putative HTH transcriptional regulator [Salinisphaera sp. LB1]